MSRLKDWKDRVWLRWILGAVLLVILFAARPLLAADISGSWDLHCWIGEGRQILTLELVQDGSLVRGKGTLRPDESADRVPVTVRAGRVHDQDFQLLLVEAGGPGGWSQEFSGSWHRDEMSGVTFGEEFGSRIFTGARRSAPRPRHRDP